MKRVALYVRVSTEEQQKHGLSVDAQIKALEAYSKANNYTIHKIYNDAGISARKSYKKRPALLEMIADCQQGKIDLILICKLDRFFRSVSDYYAVMDQIGNVPWKAIQEDYETETSSGVFKVNIMLSVAQSEADKTSERIKAVNEYRRLSGDVYVGGKAPTGYIKKDKGLIIDESLREGIQAFFDDYLNTFSLEHAINTMREHNVIVTRQTASRMLKRTAYCGNASGYKCEPFITEEQHELILKSCESRSVRQTHDPFRVYLFTGIAKCGSCGGAFSGTVRPTQIKNTVKDYKYYRCHQHKENVHCDNPRTLSEMKIERYLLDNLDKELRNYNIKATTELKNTSNYNEQLSKLKSKLERIGERFEEGDISKEEYKAKRQIVLNSINDIESQLATTPQKKTLNDDWKEVYNSLDEHHKRAFWHSIIENIYISKDASIRIKFH